MDPDKFVGFLEREGIRFFTGVPDSLLKDFCKYLLEHCSKGQNVIAPNEGNAVALACGHYLATGEIALCYMQNSGLGNATNPMLSLSDEMVYGIPVLYLIGMRGKKGEKDEPQHLKQGLVTKELLEVMGIENRVINRETDRAELFQFLSAQLQEMKKNGKSFALLVEKDTFTKYSGKKIQDPDFEMSREEAIETLLPYMEKNFVASTTGHISRELFECRERRGETHERDFLTVGSMGHTSMIAFGLAKSHPRKKFYILDGDGAVLMHMGALATIGTSEVSNIIHVVFNNGSHDSVGGQPTVALEISLAEIAEACGYSSAKSVSTKEELEETMKKLNTERGNAFLEVRVRKGARKDLGRPTISPKECKENFMKALQEDSE